MGSTRLPGKALLPLGNSTVTGQAMRSLKVFKADVYAVLTDETSAPQLTPHVQNEGFDLFIGDPEDVLNRYAEAVRFYQPDIIVRATGDNPLVAGELIEPLLRLHIKEGADYSGFDDLPCGAGVEIVSAHALLTADTEAADPYEREHVNPFLYRRPGRFKILRTPAPESARYAQGRITIDHPEDYRYVKALFDHEYAGKPFTAAQVISLMKGLPKKD